MVARAQEYGRDVAEVDILPGWRQADGTHFAGVRIRLAPGWKTYWRAPGEAGIPPDFNWSGSENLRAVKIHWPRPEVFVISGLTSVGYHDEVTFPVEITPGDPSQPVALNLALFFGVCEDICIPSDVDVSAVLQPGVTPSAPLVRAALAQVPQGGAANGVTSVICGVTPASPRGFAFQAEIQFNRAVGAAPYAVVETGAPDIWSGPATARAEGTGVFVTGHFDSYGTGPVAIARDTLRMTLLGVNAAIDLRGCLPG